MLLSTSAPVSQTVSSRSPQPPLQRPLVLVISVAVLAAQGMGVVHELTTAHSVCAAHGETVHADAHPAPSSTTPLDVAGPVLLAGEDHLPAAHAHCEALAVPAHRLVQSRLELPAPRVVTRGPGPVYSAIVSEQQPRFRLAPKSSPPASV